MPTLFGTCCTYIFSTIMKKFWKQGLTLSGLLLYSQRQKCLAKVAYLKKKKCSHAQIRAPKSIGLPQNESPYLKGMLSIPQIYVILAKIWFVEKSPVVWILLRNFLLCWTFFRAECFCFDGICSSFLRLRQKSY